MNTQTLDMKLRKKNVSSEKNLSLDNVPYDKLNNLCTEIIKSCSRTNMSRGEFLSSAKYLPENPKELTALMAMLDSLDFRPDEHYHYKYLIKDIVGIINKGGHKEFTLFHDIPIGNKNDSQSPDNLYIRFFNVDQILDEKNNSSIEFSNCSPAFYTSFNNCNVIVNNDLSWLGTFPKGTGSTFNFMSPCKLLPYVNSKYCKYNFYDLESYFKASSKLGQKENSDMIKNKSSLYPNWINLVERGKIIYSDKFYCKYEEK
ncbi:MAG TPA: hypothetical protein VEC16_06890 [Alphaproteobacteria bacterium]|nr:hypothetical protein [Alphaproteobacteria bacterium]